MKKISLLGTIIMGVAVVSTTFAALPNFSTQVLPRMFEQGLTKFSSSTDFRSNDSIVRGEAAKFVASFGALKNLAKNNTACDFSDIGSYDNTLVPHIKTACAYGLLKGSSGKFLPTNVMTEAQALAIVIRSTDGIQDETMSPWYKAYYTKAQAKGLITNETLTSINTTNVTRGKLGTWFYLSTKDTMVKEDTMIISAGMYTEWSEDAVKSALAEGKKVALFFHASRCPSCVGANKDLMTSTLAKNSVIFKVNYDTATDLKVQYGVTSQHTFVFLDKEMNATSKKSGLSASEVIVMLQ